jgi:sugar phosphate isomerase/epimerase
VAKLVCLTLPYAKFPLERAVSGIAEAGYRYVGLGWYHQGEDVLGADPDGPSLRRCMDLCQDAGLAPVVTSGTGTGPPNRAEKLKRRIDIAAALGAEVIQMGGVGGYRRFPQEPLEASEFDEAHGAFVADMEQVGPHAEDRGIVVALKPHTGNTATARHLADLLPQIGSPAVQACYDPGNVRFYEGISPEDDFPLIADRTYEIVAKDHRGPRAEADFPIPGGGDVDFARIFATARQAGFDGPVIVERVDGTGGPYSPEEIDARVREARQNLERLIPAAGLTLEE